MSERTEAQRRATKKWNDANMKEKYDRIQLVTPKGRKEVIQAQAEAVNQSLNAFVLAAVDERIERIADGQEVEE